MAISGKYIFLVMSLSVEVFELGHLPEAVNSSVQSLPYAPQENFRVISAVLHDRELTDGGATFTCLSWRNNSFMVNILPDASAPGRFSLDIKKIRTSIEPSGPVWAFAVSSTKYLWIRQTERTSHTDDYATNLSLLLTQIPKPPVIESHKDDVVISDIEQVLSKDHDSLPALGLTTCLDFDEVSGRYLLGNSLGQVCFGRISGYQCASDEPAALSSALSTLHVDRQELCKVPSDLDLPDFYQLPTSTLLSTVPEYLYPGSEDSFAKEILSLVGDEWSADWTSCEHWRDWAYPSFRRWRRIADVDKRHGFAAVWNRVIQEDIGALGDIVPCFFAKDYQSSALGIFVFRIGPRVYYAAKRHGGMLVRPLETSWPSDFSEGNAEQFVYELGRILPKVVNEYRYGSYPTEEGAGYHIIQSKNFDIDVFAEKEHMMIDAGHSVEDIKNWNEEDWGKHWSDYYLPLVEGEYLQDGAGHVKFFEYEQDWYDKLGEDRDSVCF